MSSRSINKCKICKNEIHGRSDKIFCSLRCKNFYHTNLRRVTDETTRDIDVILHRNRSILLELMGKNSAQKKIKRIELEKKKFHFNYLTHFYTNSKGKIYHWVYDFAWMAFSDDEILILRKRS
ncbi:hypothetical protein ACH3O9_17855 [Leeuwenhoekiella sp. A16]|uniref:hypothetical protein n=1 Tax=unclassified Leeuwenhoekiella TaxID=2615029 RepID=UPI003A7FF271